LRQNDDQYRRLHPATLNARMCRCQRFVLPDIAA
jgi:hypothetical protein